MLSSLSTACYSLLSLCSALFFGPRGVRYSWYHAHAAYKIALGIVLGIFIYSIEAVNGEQSVSFLQGLLEGWSATSTAGVEFVDTSLLRSGSQLMLLLGMLLGGGALVSSVVPLIRRHYMTKAFHELPLERQRDPQLCAEHEIKRAAYLVNFFVTLVYIVSVHTALFLFLGIYAASSPSVSLLLSDASISPWFFALFHSVGAFGNCGFALLATGVADFSRDPGILLPLTLGSIAGGIFFPAGLRFTFWALHKCCFPRNIAFKFALNNPCVCAYSNFVTPSMTRQITAWNAGIFLFEFVAYCATASTSGLEDYSYGGVVLLAIFSGSNTRAAGLAATSMFAASPVMKSIWLIAMYLPFYPIFFDFSQVSSVEDPAAHVASSTEDGAHVNRNNNSSSSSSGSPVANSGYLNAALSKGAASLSAFFPSQSALAHGDSDADAAVRSKSNGATVNIEDKENNEVSPEVIAQESLRLRRANSAIYKKLVLSQRQSGILLAPPESKFFPPSHSPASRNATQQSPPRNGRDGEQPLLSHDEENDREESEGDSSLSYAVPAPPALSAWQVVVIESRYILQSEFFLLSCAFFLILAAEGDLLQSPSRPEWLDIFGVIFEIGSSFGNVGYSMSPTPVNLAGYLSSWSKLVLVYLMLAGNFRGVSDDADPFWADRDYWPSAKLAERNRRRPDATSASTASAAGAGGESPSADETKQAAEEAASAERTRAIMESIKPFSGIFMRSKTSLINYNS